MKQDEDQDEHQRERRKQDVRTITQIEPFPIAGENSKVLVDHFEDGCTGVLHDWTYEIARRRPCGSSARDTTVEERKSVRPCHFEEGMRGRRTVGEDCVCPAVST